MLKVPQERSNARFRGWPSASAMTLGCLCGAAFLAGYLILERGRALGLVSVQEPPPAQAAEAPPPELHEVKDHFLNDENITEALTRNGLSGQEVYQLVEQTRPVYDLARVIARRPFSLRFTAEGRFQDFRYALDDERYLTVYRLGDGYVPVVKQFAFEMHSAPAAGVIEGSLFAAVTECGEDERLALDLADIFQWDIDFYTDIQRGDSFRLLVEKRYLDGVFKGYGAIQAAEIINNGKTFRAFRFELADGKADYYGPDGKAMKKSFLKSPLKFARITSRFSYARRHPILKIVRPHLGVDYGAPVGTPVVAVGTGTVVAAGRDGASGKMVALRHIGGFETMYLHLSRIAVRAGARVTQGEIIGYVGATGLASGPHLDFRVKQHGRYINPTRVVFPPAPPVPAVELARFGAAREVLESELVQIQY